MGNETYYRNKTLEYFRKQGYIAESIERQQVISRKGSRPIFKKNDLFGGDVLACNDTETILANSVKNKTNISKHKRNFEKYPSGGLRRLIVAWTPRVSEPFVVEMPK